MLYLVGQTAGSASGGLGIRLPRHTYMLEDADCQSAAGSQPVPRKIGICPTKNVSFLLVLCAALLLQCGANGFEKAPDSAAAWIKKGQALMAQNDAAAALSAFQSALALDPKSAEAEDDIGFIMAATNQPAEAISHFERAISMD